MNDLDRLLPTDEDDPYTTDNDRCRVDSGYDCQQPRTTSDIAATTPPIIDFEPW